jgi:hypothetical protein
VVAACWLLLRPRHGIVLVPASPPPVVSPLPVPPPPVVPVVAVPAPPVEEKPPARAAVPRSRDRHRPQKARASESGAADDIWDRRH